ncbi:TolC family protein [Pseudomonas sp. Pseusp3]|uniref:TolC family protein n=1 Tax=Pseudomonas sp. Pseusp3 TaxID=3243029 RepID=UPI0039AFFC36
MSSGRALMVTLLCLFTQSGKASMEITRQLSAPTLHDGHSRSALLSQQATHISLGDAVYLGLRNHRGIRSAYLQRVGQKFDLRVAKDAFSPKLLLKGHYTDNQGSEDRVRKTSLSPSVSLLGEYGTRLSVSWTRQLNDAERAGRFRGDGLELTLIQPLLRGAGRDVSTAPLRLEQLKEQANRLNLKTSVSQAIVDIITTYRELLRSQEQLAIVQEALRRTRSLLDVNKALITAGRMAEFEIVQTEAEIAVQEMDVEEAQNQVHISRLDLLRLLALDLSTPLHASEVLEAFRITIDQPEALRLAQIQQPQYLSMLLGSHQADLNLLIAKDQARWDVSLVAGATQIHGRYDNGIGSGRNWDSYAGVQLEIPIGALSTRQAEIHAHINLQTQEINLADARQELERDVNNAVRELGTRWRQYEIAQRATELSRRKLEIEQEKLNAGRSSNFQIISFESDLRNAENARLSALISYLNAQTQLDLTLGMTLESWEIALNDV